MFIIIIIIMCNVFSSSQKYIVLTFRLICPSWADYTGNVHFKQYVNYILVKYDLDRNTMHNCLTQTGV